MTVAIPVACTIFPRDPFRPLSSICFHTSLFFSLDSLF